MKTLIKRNLKLYFRDKVNIFFSMLAILIIIGLFAIFLGQGNWGGEGIRDSWLMAGVLAVAAITVSMGSFEIVISDRLNKTAKGFYASPVPRSHITASYILSPFITGTLMTVLTAIGFSIYLVVVGIQLPNAIGMAKLIGLILLSNLTGTAILCFIVSITKSMSAWNTIGTILGTGSGFLMGVYMPIGQLPAAVQYVMVAFPPFHGAMLFRQIIMDAPMSALEYAYGAVHATEYPYEVMFNRAEIEEVLGVTFSFGDFQITPIMSVAYLAVSAVIFYWLAAARMKKLGK